MGTPTQKFQTIDEYIQLFPTKVQDILEKIRTTIKEQVPEVTEVISYQIPCLKFQGKNLIYFAGWKSHVSVYPIPPGTEAFNQKIAPYITGKGTLQFPLNKPIPYGVIKEVAKFSMKRNLNLYGKK